MEETRGISDPENGSSSYGGKPPNPLSFSSSSAAAAVYRQSLDVERSLAPCNKRSLVRHPSLVRFVSFNLIVDNSGLFNAVSLLDVCILNVQFKLILKLVS